MFVIKEKYMVGTEGKEIAKKKKKFLTKSPELVKEL